MRLLLYPLFGSMVLGSYLFVVSRGIEPFSVSTERHQTRPGVHAAAGTSRRRPGGIFFYGGFRGGK